MKTVSRRERQAMAVCFLILIVGFVFTIWKGARDVQQRAITDFGIPTQLPAWNRAQGPYYICNATAVSPFLVHVRFGWQKGERKGAGGSAVYLWLFGWSVELFRYDMWDS